MPNIMFAYPMSEEQKVFNKVAKKLYIHDYKIPKQELFTKEIVDSLNAINDGVATEKDYGNFTDLLWKSDPAMNLIGVSKLTKENWPFVEQSFQLLAKEGLLAKWHEYMPEVLDIFLLNMVIAPQRKDVSGKEYSAFIEDIIRVFPVISIHLRNASFYETARPENRKVIIETLTHTQIISPDFLWNRYMEAWLKYTGENTFTGYTMTTFDALADLFIFDTERDKVYIKWPGWEPELIYSLDKGLDLKMLTKYLFLSQMVLDKGYKPEDFVRDGKYRVAVQDGGKVFSHIIFVNRIQNKDVVKEREQASKNNESIFIMVDPHVYFIEEKDEQGNWHNVSGYEAIPTKEQLMQRYKKLANRSNVVKKKKHESRNTSFKKGRKL